jgi:pyridoxine 5'-phosphate synthase PdxJ
MSGVTRFCCGHLARTKVKRAAESIGHGAKIALNKGLGVQAGAELAVVRLVPRSAVPSSANPR